METLFIILVAAAFFGFVGYRVGKKGSVRGALDFGSDRRDLD
jgi:hypothetical protein